MLAQEVIDQNVDKELQDDAAWLLSQCAEDLGNIDDARNALRTLLRRWPRSALDPRRAQAPERLEPQGLEEGRARPARVERYRISPTIRVRVADADVDGCRGRRRGRGLPGRASRGGSVTSRSLGRMPGGSASVVELLARAGPRSRRVDHVVGGRSAP